MVTDDQIKNILFREFKNGSLPNNKIENKIERWKKIHQKEPKFDQEQFNRIPYIYRHETKTCFVHGEFFASISLCGVIVEKILSEKLQEKNNLTIQNFSTLIDVCEAFEIIDNRMSEKAHKIRKTRNSFVHPSDEKWEKLSKRYNPQEDSEIIEQIALDVYEDMIGILGHLYPLKWPPKE